MHLNYSELDAEFLDQVIVDLASKKFSKGGVVRVFLNPQSSFSEEKFAEKVMKTIGLPYTQSGTNVMALLSQGLCESQEELPIFVIEADNRCTPGELRSLLILMMQMKS